jgi:hypothetical protein
LHVTLHPAHVIAEVTAEPLLAGRRTILLTVI